MTNPSDTAESASDGYEVESRLRLELDGPVDVPRVQSLFQLQQLCQPGRDETEFWQWVAIAAARDLCGDVVIGLDEVYWSLNALSNRRYLADRFGLGVEGAEAAICGEINCFLNRIFQGDDMAKPASKPIAKPKVKGPIQETDDELLAASLQSAGIVGPHTDAELLVKIQKRWKIPAKAKTTRSYAVASADLAYGTAIWFDTEQVRMGRPGHWYDEHEEEESCKGFLLDEVRRVLKVPHGADAPPQEPGMNLPKVEDLKRAGKSRAKIVDPVATLPTTNGPKLSSPDKPIISASELLAGVIVVEERDVEYARIIRSKQNPRHQFDEELIAQMRPNIVTICQVSPLTIRETSFELIDGETRHRAAQGVPGADKLRCKIIRCTDAQAAMMRLQTSMQRRDLNPIEKASALQALLDQHGLTQRQLGDVVKLQQGSIDNLVRLLKLPDAWKQQLISGEITAAGARELVPWITEAKVLEAVLKKAKGVPVEKRSTKLGDLLQEVAWELSEPIKSSVTSGAPHYHHAYVTIAATPEQREQLRIRKVKRYHNSEERCFNIPLWKTLFEVAKKKAFEQFEKKDKKSSKPGNVDPKQAAENAKKQQEMFQKKLYRYRVAWLQQRLLPTVDTATIGTLMKYALMFCSISGESASREDDIRDLVAGTKEERYGNDSQKLLSKMLAWPEGDVTKHLRSLVKRWLGGGFEGYQAALEPESIEILAKDAGVDAKRDWPHSCKNHGNYDPLQEYLGLLGKDQLFDLAAEWKLTIKVSNGAKRSDLIEAIEKSGRGKPTPKALLEVKPIRLS